MFGIDFQKTENKVAFSYRAECFTTRPFYDVTALGSVTRNRLTTSPANSGRGKNFVTVEKLIPASTKAVVS
jgi:hypothetical protein